MSAKFVSRVVAIAAAAGAMASSAQAQTFLDLTITGSSGYLNGAFFEQIPNGSTGTGVIEPFVRIQANGTEEGFNTDAKGVLDNKDGTWTHSVLLSSLPTVVIGGVNYYQLLLDINESGSKPLITLDGLKAYQVATGDLTTLSGQAGNLRWDLDAGTDRSIGLNYDLNPGSGYGDIFAYIPTSLFSNDPSKPYFVLYSSFGKPESTDAGFEEWAYLSQTPTAPIPEPGTYALMLAGLAAVGFVARRRKTTSA